MGTDIAIDLGTSRTRIYIVGHGIALDEPTVVAVNLDDNRIIAVGHRAYKMVGRTSSKIATIFPLEGGVISDFSLVEELLDYFLKKIGSSKIVMPRAVACVPGEITDVEKRAVVNCISSVGIRRVCLIEEPVAAAIGANLDIATPRGHMIVNIGGGTTDIAIVSLNGIAASRTVKLAGNKIDDAIIKYVKKNHRLLIGKRMAEDAKTSIGRVIDRNHEEFFRLKGRDSLTGMPKWIDFSSAEMKEAIEECAIRIVKEIQLLLEDAPPELAGDIYTEGISLTGGSSLLYGFDKLISEKTGLNVRLAENPKHCVVLGAGIATKYIGNLDKKDFTSTNPLSAEF